MGIPSSQQLSALLYSLLCGVLLGVLQDVLAVPRILCGFSEPARISTFWARVSLPGIGRINRPTDKTERRCARLILLSVGDILFAVCAGAVFSLFLYHRASGVFRWFYLFGAGTGWFVYSRTLGRLTAALADAAAYVVRAAVLYLLLPLRMLGRLVRFTVSMMQRVLWEPFDRALKQRLYQHYTARVQKTLPQLMSFSEEGANGYAMEE